MKNSRRRLSFLIITLSLVLNASQSVPVPAQSRRQPPTSDEKKNKRPPEGKPSEEKVQEPLPTDIIGKPAEGDTVKVTTNLVNVDAVVYSKKNGQIVTDLKKGNFEVYVDVVKRDITNFGTPEAPITVSRMSAGNSVAGSPEVRPAAYFGPGKPSKCQTTRF